MQDRWITDDTPSERFRYYTRANADEVGPDPFSPLGWTLGWVEGCIPGVADGFVSFGVVRREELREQQPEVFGNWGGYFYNQLSLPRMMGVRMPGASPEAIDQAYFGDHPGVPPYVPDPRDEDPELTVKLGETMAFVMSAQPFPAMEDAAAMARRVVSERPDFTAMTNEELVAFGRATAPLIREAWGPYCEVCLGASLGPGAVQAVCAGVGRPEDAVKLLAAVGRIESAEASVVMWDLGRIVAASPELMAQFDDGVDGILDRLRASAGSSPDAAEFLAAFDALLAEYGHRGPNEWDMRAHSWDTKPVIALSMIERLRLQPAERSPHGAAERSAAERERLAAELDAVTAADAESNAMLRAGMAAAATWFQLREMGKNAVIRLIHEGKLAFLELGGRMTEAGVIDEPQQIFMLMNEELDAFLDDPASFRDTLLERDTDFARLHDLEPPYIVKADDGVPPISSWVERGSSSTTTVGVGDVLQGAPAAPGVATGRARIILDPSDPMALEPGDIMVCHTTDPSWTPLFLSAAGVVCDVGAVASHAAIVSRELGVPCAVSVVEATRRIPDGATITIDGSTGTVTVDSL